MEHKCNHYNKITVRDVKYFYLYFFDISQLPLLSHILLVSADGAWAHTERWHVSTRLNHSRPSVIIAGGAGPVSHLAVVIIRVAQLNCKNALRLGNKRARPSAIGTRLQQVRARLCRSRARGRSFSARYLHISSDSSVEVVQRRFHSLLSVTLPITPLNARARTHSLRRNALPLRAPLDAGGPGLRPANSDLAGVASEKTWSLFFSRRAAPCGLPPSNRSFWGRACQANWWLSNCPPLWVRVA